MTDAIAYLRLADEFGWTPEEIDRMDADFVKKALIFLDAREIATRRLKKEVENIGV